MRVTVIGQGYVGLSLAIGAAKVGHQVIGVDISEKLIQQLEAGDTFVPGIDKTLLTSLVINGRYHPTSNFELMNGSEVIIIAVPTPLDNFRKPDITFVEAACLQIAKKVTSRALIVNESTSYPGTLRNFIKKIVEDNCDTEFWYASAPERIDPGNGNWTLSNTPRVISGLTKEATLKAIEFYQSFCSQVQEVSSPEVAEASKLFENSFRQINIALANEFAKISHTMNFSANEAIYAASTKPFGFMPFFPSIGVGGHCIPVDPSYLSYAAELAGGKAEFIDLANSTNLSMATYTVNRIKEFLEGSLRGKSVQVAGITYKPDVPDLRESPSLLLIEELEREGAEVTWSDPVVKEYKGMKSLNLNPNVDLGLLVVPHESFDFSTWKKAGTAVLDLSANPTDYGWPKFF